MARVVIDLTDNIDESLLVDARNSPMTKIYVPNGDVLFRPWAILRRDAPTPAPCHLLGHSFSLSPPRKMRCTDLTNERSDRWIDLNRPKRFRFSTDSRIIDTQK